MNTENRIKTKTKAYTASELASLCGVIVGSISVLIKKQNLKLVKAGQDSVGYYGAGALKQLRLHCAESRPRHDKTNNARDLRAQLAAARFENQLLRDQLESTKSTTKAL